MKLQEFLALVKRSYSEIVILKGEDAIKAVESDGYALRYVKDQTPEVCLKAVESDGDALQYVKDQTPEVCLKAVESDGYALQYVDTSTFDNED